MLPKNLKYQFEGESIQGKHIILLPTIFAVRKEKKLFLGEINHFLVCIVFLSAVVLLLNIAPKLSVIGAHLCCQKCKNNIW